MTTTYNGTQGLSLLAGMRNAADRLLDWWRQGLMAWLSPRWRARLGLSSERLLLAVDEPGVVCVLLHDPATLRELARLPPPVADSDLAAVLEPRMAALPRWAMLAPARALRRRMVLPSAAGASLRAVAAFEIERQTPFEREAVEYDARLLGPAGSGRIETELVVVPRNAVAAFLADLGPVADGLHGMDVAAADGQPLGVDVLPSGRRVRRRDPWRAWNRWLLLAILGVVALAAWQVLQNRRAAASAFAVQVEAEARQAREVAARQQRLQHLVDGHAFLDQARAARPTMVELLDEITRRLPLDSHLEKLAVEGDQLLVIGYSPDAAGLVPRMEDSELWTSPALSGSVLADRGTRKDRFTLTARLAGASAASEGGRGVDGGD